MCVIVVYDSVSYCLRLGFSMKPQQQTNIELVKTEGFTSSNVIG